MRISSLVARLENATVAAAQRAAPKVSYAGKYTQHKTVSLLHRLADKLDTTKKLA